MNHQFEQEFKTIEAVHLIDLDRFIPYSNSDYIKSLFIEPQAGFYYPGDIMPLLDVTIEGVFYATDHFNVTPINYGELIQSPKNYIELNRISAFSQNNKKIYPHELCHATYKEHLDKSVQLKKIMIYLAVDYFSSLSPLSKVWPSFYHRGFTLEHLLQQEYVMNYQKTSYQKYLSIKEDLDCYFDSFMMSLINFVNGDHWKHYRLELTGSTLVLFKGIDLRIIDWYRKQNHNENDEWG